MIARHRSYRHERRIPERQASAVSFALVPGALLLFVCLVLPGAPSALAQGSASINYVYDDLGRLVAVVDPQGNVATYTYDAVGNLLGISRVNAGDFTGNVAITYFTPTRGQGQTTVTIYGKGFLADVTQNTVRFNGTLATVTTAEPNRLVTSVPAAATTGPITVQNSQGSASTSPSVFTIGLALAISPTSVTLGLGATQQFQATEGGTPTTTVTWAVNGVTGGDPTTVGAISNDPSTLGLYTAPTLSPTRTVSVTAIQANDRSSASPPASVTIIGYGGYLSVNRNVGTAVSVQLADSLSTFLVAAQTAVGVAPVVTMVTPASGVHGTNFDVTLTGVGFTGVTAVQMLLGGSTDTTITVGPPTVTSDTQLTVHVTLSSTAAPGIRVVRISTPSALTVLGTGGNQFTVQ